MSSGWKSTDYIKDALDAIEKISQFIQGMTYESFVNDDKTLFAVVRGIEIIGEATKNLSKERKEAYPDLPGAK